jgi:molecular chaperone GrpE (heat shock protein)
MIMATHPNTRRDVIDELLVTRRHAQRLAISLRFQGQDTDADQVEEREKQLRDQIDELLAGVMKTWDDKTEALLARLKNSNARLSRDVDKIRERENAFGAVASAIGHLDDVIRTIGLLPGM